MRRAALAAVPLLLVAGLSGCGGEHAAAGTTIRTEKAPTGTPVTLVSPLGTATVTVGEPVGSIGKEQANDLKSHHAPDGGAFVPVTWSFSYAAAFPASRTGAIEVPATLSLVAGGHRYDLQRIGRSVGATVPEYVAVASSKDLQVGLTYDGLTQTVDVATGKRHAGAAEALYDAKPTTIDCGKGWSTSIPIKAPMACSLQVAVVPWAGSWASAGHEYVVVQADIRPYPLEIHRGASYARYDVRTIADQSTVDGATASQPFQQDSSARYVVGGTSVFEVATGTHTLDLKLEYALQRGGQTGSGKYPLDPTVTFTRSVPLS